MFAKTGLFLSVEGLTFSCIMNIDKAHTNGGFEMKKIMIIIFLTFVLFGCTAGEQYTANRIILSYDTTQLTEEEMERYSEAYGTLPPEFVVLVFSGQVKLARAYAENGSDANMQTSIVLKQRMGEPWSTDVVMELLLDNYTLIDGDHENEYIFFLNNGLAVDVIFEENGNITFSIGRNLRQVDGLLYVMPYGVTSWEDKYAWYRDVCRSCLPHILDENNFRFSFENKLFRFTKEANGVYTVEPYQP